MEKTTLELETVTPLFIAGADQRNIENEGLRAPSLRGLLRWWFRAIMGGIVSTEDLRELESKIFGSTDQKSSVKILSTTKSQPSEISIPSDLRYLWFSIHMQKRKNQRLQCYLPKTKFKITLSSDDEDNLKITLGCLWTLIYLGGAGARMRRGAGSLKINNVSGKIPYTFIFTGNTSTDAKEFIEKNLAEIFGDFKEYAGEKYNPQTNPNFAVLSKNHAKMSLIQQPLDTWEECLMRVGNIYKNFRTRSNVKVEERFIWGLPIRSPQNLRRFENLLKKNLQKKGWKEEKIEKEIKRLRKLKENELLREIEISADKTKQIFLKLLLLEKLRQASPLLIGVMDLNGKYAIRLVKFYTSIHPDFSSKLRFLRQDLDYFDNIVAKNKELGEMEIELPV